jgi:hypothetical protein
MAGQVPMKPEPEIEGLIWQCHSCKVKFAVYAPYELGDSEPCTECPDGTTEVVKGTLD